MRNLIFLLASLFVVHPYPLLKGYESLAQTRRKTKVDVKYDKRKELSTVWLEELVLWKNPVGFQQVTMAASFNYPKRVIVTPKTVSLRFRSATEDRSPFVGDKLVAVVDGVRLELGKFEDFDNRSLTTTPGNFLFDRVSNSISYEDFVKLAQARSLTMIVASRDYKLSTEQIQMLRDFLELMQAQGQEFK